MAKPKNMIADEESVDLDAPVEQKEPEGVDFKQPAGKAAGRGRAKVNMHLPDGSVLVKGQPVQISEAGHAHLKKHFGDKMKHIIE